MPQLCILRMSHSAAASATGSVPSRDCQPEAESRSSETSLASHWKCQCSRLTCHSAQMHQWRWEAGKIIQAA
jgi:hypothetical protein